MVTEPSPRRRVLFVQHYPGLGGATISMISLIEGLDRSRYEPVVLFTSGEGAAIDILRDEGVEVHSDAHIDQFPHAQGAWMPLRSERPWLMLERGARLWPSAKRFAGWVERLEPDLVHLNSLVQLPAAVGTKLAGVPLVWHVREELHPGHFGVRTMLVRQVVRQCADACVAISERNASLLPPGVPARVVYNFVDFERFDPSQVDRHLVRHELGLDDATPIVGMLGGVVHNKGADRFLRAASHLLGQHPSAHFVIAGAPAAGESPVAWRRLARRGIEGVLGVKPMERRLRELLEADAHLAERVHVVGMRRDIPELLSALDVLVWPTDVSHFSRPIIEAGAMARPVVAVRTAAAEELVQDGDTGLLVEADDADLAQGIARVLEDEALAARLGAGGRRLALERYDAKRNVPATVATYDDVLGTPAGAAP